MNSLADQFGTPLYVYDLDVMRQRLSDLAPFDVVRYAQKACSNLGVLDFVRQQGAVLDAVSLGEIRRALAAGFPPTGSPPPIVYTSDVFTRKTLDEVVQNGIRVNAGSPDMIRQLGERVPGAELTLRVNPGFGHGHSQKTNTGGAASKHGIWHSQLDECLQMCSRFNLAVTGLHMHIGSGADLEHLARVANSMHSAAMEVGRTINSISAGGGLPIPYEADETPVDINSYYQIWNDTRSQLAEEFGHPVSLEIEPGRFVAAESGVLITEILAVKETPEHTFYLVDAGFNNLARPILYGAYHRISLATRRDETRKLQPVVIAGPLCESGDVFTQQEGGIVAPREMPKARVGERLVIHDAGAYGAAMASNYNSMPLAAEVATLDGVIEVLRDRQPVEQLWVNERIPNWQQVASGER